MIQPDLAVRDAVAGDAAAIALVYNHYVETTSISMETDAVGSADMRARIAAVQAAGLPWLVLLDAGEFAGYAYASPWRARPRSASGATGRSRGRGRRRAAAS